MKPFHVYKTGDLVRLSDFDWSPFHGGKLYSDLDSAAGHNINSATELSNCAVAVIVSVFYVGHRSEPYVLLVTSDDCVGWITTNLLKPL